MNKIIKEVKCPKCGNITEFDITELQASIKFDYKCQKCGIFHMIKLEPTTNKFTQQYSEYFNNYIFTIEDKRDPFWETECRKIGMQLVEKVREGKSSTHFILVQLSKLSAMQNLEEYLTEQNILQPDNSPMRRSIIQLLKKKLEKANKILDEKRDGTKW